MGNSGYIPSTSEFSSGSHFLEFHRNFKNELSDSVLPRMCKEQIWLALAFSGENP